MTIGTRLFTWWKGERVGEDAFGNAYYREKGERTGRRERRWVLYKGEPEASKVPPDWHAWLHHIVVEAPTAATQPAPQPWSKPHLPNLTGTTLAYRPPGHVLKGGQRTRSAGDYEPWQPS